jgi:hypothetical protein
MEKETRPNNYAHLAAECEAMAKLNIPSEWKEEFKINAKAWERKAKKYWDCIACEGHGVIIRDNKLVECEACMGDF